MIHITPCLISFRDFQTRAKNLILLFIVALATVFISVETRGVQQVQTYTVADGLVGPVVPVIFQDSRGILWFGSNQDGVSRFDGNTFESHIGVPDASADYPYPMKKRVRCSEKHDSSWKINGGISGFSRVCLQKP